MSQSIAYSKDTANTQFGFHNIQKVLINQLERSRQQSPGSFSTEVYVLPAVDDDVEQQLEQELQRERQDHRGKRIVLIPYCLENSHWIGVLIEFQSIDRVLRAEYIDPISGSNVTLDRLQKQLNRIYPSVVLQPRNLLKHADQRFSSALTVRNLLTAVETDQRSSSSSQSISTTSIQTKGKHYKLHELEQELNNGLGKLKIRGVDMLPQKIQKTEERIRDFEEEDRMNDVEKEKAILRELQHLQNLANEIPSLKHEPSVSDDSRQKELEQLKEELANGLAQMKIRDADMLPQKITRTEERIRDYEEEERTYDVEKEMAVLKELQQLQNLADEIARLTRELSTPQQGNQLKHRQMKEELVSCFEKLKIRDEVTLSQRIAKAKERIKDYEEDERTEDVEKEMAVLKELERLQNLANEIAKLTQELSTPQQDDQLKIRQMKQELSNAFAKLKIQDETVLSQKIQKTQARIKDYEEDERTEDAEKEMIILKELQQLQNLANEIAKLTAVTSTSLSGGLDSQLPEDNLTNTSEKISTSLLSTHDSKMSSLSDSRLNTLETTNSNSLPFDERKKELVHINDLRTEAENMPACARKTVIQLIVYFEEKVLGIHTDSQNQDASLQMLKDQTKREELLTDDIKTLLHYLETHFTNKNYSKILEYLNELLVKLRSLNVPEIQRLVAKAKNAAELIKSKDIVLLIGTTGSGKSTTIQFLSGAKMEKTQVEISPGKYLEHVTAVGPFQNPDLKNIVSSPLQKSETRYIAPVTVQLEHVLGPQETDVIILCDAPGFGDTAGPEVDIANSIGVIEALKGANSVKLLALLSYKGLGDRGQGVQKLAHILISMVHRIEERLESIVYAFTKYPEGEDINALLMDIKRSKVDADVILKSDTTFVSVLKDMIEKTEDNVFRIEPIKDEPKKLVRKLQRLRGIKNPSEVFRFSMSEETRASISDHVQRDKFSIICAMKHNDHDLALYYLNDLRILKDLLKESFIRDAYEESIRFVSESISNHCRETQEKFNRALASQDGLQKKDVLDYQELIEYVENAQILKQHLESSLLSPESILQNIVMQLNQISRSLNEKELHSPLVTIYLQNLSMLKNSFPVLEETYKNNCKIFQKRFDELVENARELIPKNDFIRIAEILFNIYQSVLVLKYHLQELIEEVYNGLIKHLLRYLNSFSEKAEPLLAKVRLNDEEIETIKNYMEILRSAKENATLQERIFKYFETLRKKTDSTDEHDSHEEKLKDVKEIYDEFIVRIIKYFDEINQRIKDLFDTSGDQALEHIQSLVKDMDALRTIPELESKTAGTYYHTVENIRSYMQQLKADAEKLVIAIDQQTGITNFKYLARSLARLKNAKWIDQVSPGTYDNLMRRITEDLVQYASQLEENLMRIDFSLKCPENVSAAKEIVEKIESMRDLERSVPELEKYRTNIVDRFLQCTQTAFDRIQKTFDLQDKDIYLIKQKLQELEEIKRHYENLHPARVFLQKQGYIDINMLDTEIEELKKKQKAERQAKEAAAREVEAELDKLNKIVREYMTLCSSQPGMFEKLTTMIGSGQQDKSSQANVYLQKLGYSSIQSVYDKISTLQKTSRNRSQQLEDHDTESSVSLHRLESMKREYDALLAARHSSPEEACFLREKGFNNYEALDEAIQEKTKVIQERGKNKQTHHFTDRLDAATANNAIIYINQCAKVVHDRVRENAIDANESLRKYIQQYGIFLQQEINQKFLHTRTIDSEGGPFSYSQDLEMRLQELLSFSRFPHVFQCIDAADTIEQWRQQFLDFYRSISAKMEDYKVAGKLRELKDQLVIAHALTCVDRFCITIFAGNGFAALYRQYQGEINTECKAAYRTVLEHISTGDFAKADMALNDIEDNPLNPRDKAQIQNDLQSSLNKLMKDTRSIVNWLDGKIEREDNRSQIKEIKENIDKIRIACNKRNIMDLLDPTTRENLQAFDNEINEILAGIILRGLESIEAFMKADSFSEAEQGMETLSQVQRQLAGYCTSEAVKAKGEELRGRLDRIVSDVLDRNEFANVNNFSVNPPKELLSKLKTVASHGSARFTQAYTSMLNKIRQTFSLAIEEVRNLPLNERSVRIRSLNYALYFLPDDLNNQFKSQIDELNKLITDEEKAYRQELDAAFASGEEDEHGIAKIGSLAERFSKQNMHELYKILCERCQKRVQLYRTNIQKSLDEQNTQSVIDSITKILKYEECVGTYIPEIKTICENVRILVIRRFSNYCETLSNISSIEQTQVIEKAFTDIFMYVDFCTRSDKRVEEFFQDDIIQNAREAFQKMFTYFIDNSENFRVALNETNIIELYRTMSISKKWQKFTEKVSQYPLNYSLLQNLSKDMKMVLSYDSMASEFEQLVYRIKEQLSVELINDDTTRFEVKREELFNNIMNAYNISKTISMKFKDILSSPIDIDAFEREIKAKIDKIRNQLMAKASKDELSDKDADDFRNYYNHLVTFEKCVHLPGMDIKQILEDSRDKIMERVDSLNKQVMRAIGDASAVSGILVKMKFLSGNLSMFEKDINDKIDNALKTYKRSQGNAGITRLTIELEKTDIGAQLISEHSMLSGEDWRKRRDRMQKQDDLEYVLGHLSGDDLSVKVLRARYKKFYSKYNELLSQFSKILKMNDTKESDLEILVAQVNSLVSSVILTFNSVTWTQAFKDDIPDLVAHIFAVWTLKKTQCYNEERGFDETNAYLLMPHVGQVIAIFRLLGIGYEEYTTVGGFRVPLTTKISDDLVNNLIEIGTGEGKSVVMAVTACVFALTGVDVSCSCYSEMLSTRDKEDFASVFRILGIEDRIKYGTFNKLCEQLLNQQCNVREKVREMIVNNQSTLPAADTTLRVRPQILLIDEVDVFLSDKYYGGVYNPVVYLKDPSIKELIDSIWQKKNARSLSRIKALSAYQTCATKYSNWIFLFDEAIKDMLSALQSYQSSTYIVQNDRIVYVEGESIANNIVRGYDTVWAYYHENEKGNISAKSLEENVGILISCGTFSYAEMPHDFAYIGGVTGTLKTLANVEKEILEKVYEITKNTFMPSVFGTSNRDFNKINDVRVVNESEYFMNIRGDIDNQVRLTRAILVFFESEEKLMAFYNSSELSSIKKDVQVITEKVSVKDRELFIKRATMVGKITLLTRTFGRGTDFVCRNPQVLSKGGIHVLQTFFSEEISEEYQIMGRGARQGDRGSYGMILRDKDLEWVLGSMWESIIPKIKGYTLYDRLNEKRNEFYELKRGGKDLAIKQCEADHNASKHFVNALTTGDIEAVKEFLMKQNKGANLITPSSRTVLLMDATGSMYGLLSAAKETVCTMFERASTVLAEKGLSNDAFQMQFVVYRDYDSRADGLLQSSSWETKPNNLKNFMERINAMGGGDYEEAIEVGLWHAVQQSEQPEGLSQVILIADAPAKCMLAINRDREATGGEVYWSTTKYKTPTHYTEELKKLKDKGIPVHAFYLEIGAKQNFEEIANETSGRCEQLNINSSEGAEWLTHFVTEEVLKKTAGDEGEAAVEHYRKKYVHAMFTS